MSPEPAPDPANVAKANLLKTINTAICLVVLLVIVWLIFGYGAKPCPTCIPLSRQYLGCGFCGGDGKISIWKSMAVAAAHRPPPAPATQAQPIQSLRCKTHSPPNTDLMWGLCRDCQKLQKRR